MTHLAEFQVLRFLAQFTLLFVCARVLADLMKRIGQATVIGELVAGIVLGPSLMGRAAPALYALIFPPDPTADHMLEALAWIGVIMLLLDTGLETDLSILKGVGKAAVMVSILGIVIPWAGGFFLGWALPARYLAAPNQRLIFALFIAVAMSISAVPVIAKILMDFDLMRRDLGMLILAAGILDDTVGWLMLSVVAGLAAHGRVDIRSAASIAIAVLLFVGFCYVLGARLVVRLMRWVDDRGAAEHAGMSAMVGIAMVSAIITQAIGIHAVFGAFIAGVMLGRSARLRKSDRTELQAATIGVFAPVFFAFSGLKVDLLALHSVVTVAVVLAIAIAGKLIGCSLGALIAGRSWRESLAVGTGMNARGGMGIIVALIGLSLGVLTREMYATVIVVALVTSLMTPPLLNLLLAGIEQRPEEKKRLEREKILARIPFSKDGAKLLVLAGGGPHAQLAAHLAAVLGNHPDASITVFQAVADEVSDSPSRRQFDSAFEQIKTVAGLWGVHNVYQRTGTADTITEAILKESERGYDAIFAGASDDRNNFALGGEILPKLVHDLSTPLIIARTAATPLPPRRILAPTTGAAFSRLATTVGIHYAQATNAAITAMYVRETQQMLLGRWRALGRSPASDQHIVDDIQQLAAELNLKVETLLETGTRAETLIVAAAERGEFDLIIIGVMPRPAEQDLNFGPKVEHILRNVRCAIAVVVSPVVAARP